MISKMYVLGMHACLLFIIHICFHHKLSKPMKLKSDSGSTYYNAVYDT